LHSIDKHLSTALSFLMVMLVVGCASVPFNYPKTPGTIVRISDQTTLGKEGLEWMEEHGEASGFIPLVAGNDALGARLKLIEGAEESIDAQYFLIKPDQAGALFVGKLLLAADRGVRVRLLIDDIFTPGLDSELSLFNTHPNVEVRLFNPMTRQSFRYWSLLVDFRRANRRMHNKAFIVDDAFSIVGGRNIAEEYFEIEPSVEFADFDMLAIGKISTEVSDIFELFWNSSLSVPIEAFGVKVDPGELDRWRQKMQAVVSGASESVYARAVGSKLLHQVLNDEVQPYVAPAEIVTDDPEKLKQKVGQQEYKTLVNALSQRVNEAESEVLVVTPYFIPQQSGVEFVKDLLDRGVRVVIVTNSLASNNHLAVHSGYARYRKPLLEAGAEIYEVKANAAGVKEEFGQEPDTLTLHTKAVLIDREVLFFGSLNLDPRSIDINTEMGVFIESPEASVAFYDIIEESLPEATYRVVLNEDKQLRWIYDYQGQREVFTKEPLTSFWRRFKVGLFSILPIEDQL